MGRIERDLFFLLPATLHQAQRVLQQDPGERLGGLGGEDGNAMIGQVDHGKGADVIGVGMGQQDRVQRSAFLEPGEVGQLATVTLLHANAGVHQEPLAGHLEQQAGGPHLVGPA